MGNSPKRFVRLITVAGATLLTVFVSSWLAHFTPFLYGFSSFYSDLREGSAVVRDIALGLNLLWVAIAVVVALARWQATTRTFRVVLLVNGILAAVSIGALR